MNENEPVAAVELIAPIVDLEPIVTVLREIRDALRDLEQTLR